MSSTRAAALEVALLVIGIAILWVAVSHPLAAEASELREQLSFGRKSLESTIARASQCESVQSRMPLLQARVDQLEKLVPGGAEVLEFVKQARARAAEVGLRVVSDRPGAPSGAGSLVRLRKEWVLEGGFRALEDWVGWIESQGRLSTVPSVTLRRMGSQGSVRCELGAELFHRPEGRPSLLGSERGS